MQEHVLGSDVPSKDPDRTVSSFALELKYGQEPSLKLPSRDPSNTREDSHNVKENPTVHRLRSFLILNLCILGVLSRN